MIHWRHARVVQVLCDNNVSQTVKVSFADGEEGLAYNDVTLHEKVDAADQVLVNATAVQLNLGSGGYYFIAAIIKRGNDEPAAHHSTNSKHDGHMMKLRYTPYQMAVLAAEEEASPYHELFDQYDELEGLPVLIGELHSMLPAVASWFKHTGMISNMKLVYIMSDGGALPIRMSRHVEQLQQLGWIQSTITYGHAYGGDLETMNKYTALLAAKHVLKADLVVVAMGPGIAGTGTRYGHTGMETGEVANAVKALNGKPILIPRVSFHDERPRHYGLSHHYVSVLSKVITFPTTIPLPVQVPDRKKEQLERQLLQITGDHEVQWIDRVTVEEVKKSHHQYPLPITTMGRGIAEDPYFFLSVAAAAHWAWNDVAANNA